jgi:hypothetical protein
MKSIIEIDYRIRYAELFSIIFIVFAYYKLVGSAASILSTIRKQLLPGGLVIVLIVFFIVMVADRVTHIQRSLSRKALLLLVISVGTTSSCSSGSTTSSTSWSSTTATAPSGLAARWH